MLTLAFEGEAGEMVDGLSLVLKCAKWTSCKDY